MRVVCAYNYNKLLLLLFCFETLELCRQICLSIRYINCVQIVTIKTKSSPIGLLLMFVRKKGLEPPRREAPDPKSGAATNYATSAVRIYLGLQR